VPVSFVSSIKGHGVPHENSSHDTGNRRVPRPEQQVKMVGHQGPGKAGRRCLHKNPVESFDKIPAVLIIAEDISTLDTTTYDMV